MKELDWILIVDDDPDNLQMLNEILEALTDLPVKKASCVDDAWQIIESLGRPPFLVISDLCMPHKYGLELFRLCPQKLPTTQFYIMSGLTSANTMVFNRAKDLLKNNFIEKPIDLIKIRTVLGSHQLLKGS